LYARVHHDPSRLLPHACALPQDEWVPLPQTFNLQKGIMRHHPELWAPQQASIIHYTDRKPWDDPQHADHAGYADIVGLWWRVYRSGGGRRRAGPLLRC
jgi:lipopolysaccharide biosynthesis glycosyltransferase